MKRVVLLLVFFASLTLRAASQEQYFPRLSFDDNPRLDLKIAIHRARHLVVLEEPPLLEKSKKSTTLVLRSVWIPNWDPPISVRINFKQDGTADLVAKTSDRTGGGAPGKLTATRTTALSKSQVTEIAKKFEALDFWNLPQPVASSGRDGAEWLMEATAHGRYHLTERWSAKSGIYRELGELLIKLSGLRDPEKIY